MNGNSTSASFRLCGFLPLSALLLTCAAFAQEPNPTSVPVPNAAVVQQGNDIFFYRVQVVQRDIDAVNYLHRSGATHIGFEGTNLLPGAKGEATVKSERGQITIDADFKGLTPANGFGPEYLTYVLWAISPDGRANNLGEVLPAGTKNNIHVTTALQSFGMIVTAEPYFSVTEPSDVIVLKNVFNDQTQGVLEKVNAHATLMPRGAYQYETDGAHSVAHPITRNERSPLELYEAYNALRIAQIAGADKYSPQIYGQANQDLQNAAQMDQDKHRDEKLEITMAREAVEKAEDARVDTLRKKAAERQRNAELAKEQAQQQAAQSQAQAQQSQAQAAEAALAAQQAQLRAQAAQLAKAQADAQAAEARAHELAANQQAADANARAAEERAKAAALREKLRDQLNAVLQTTETPRGLVVNLADVLFDTGKYTLKPNTKLSLARVAGILQAYPGLKVQVEGFTDSVGSDELNQKLSDNRASTTAEFLISQGVPAANVTSAGYGKADPVADNSTAAGRAQNRRVNLVVSGEEIGVTTTNGPSASQN
jgi:outer membrane protein OmpA-like peptidoglycan-associated protein